MAGVIPAHVLVHTAVPLYYLEDGTAEWVEGEPGTAPEPSYGRAFPCCLFLPGPGGEQPNEYRPRSVRVPTLLYNPTIPPAPPEHPREEPVVIDNEDELLISAPELAAWLGATTVRWLSVGVPQPFGRPGTVMGFIATLRQVVD